jgi:hypothetical protein
MIKKIVEDRESAVVGKFGPGKYVIGDICYFLSDNVYDNFWGKEKGYSEGFYPEQGFAVAGTAYGDGTYTGTDGKEYGVDAGIIGIVEISKAVKLSKWGNKIPGRIINVNEEVSFAFGNGIFTFIIDGNELEINTKDEEEEEENYSCDNCGNEIDAYEYNGNGGLCDSCANEEENEEISD